MPRTRGHAGESPQQPSTRGGAGPLHELNAQSSDFSGALGAGVLGAGALGAGALGRSSSKEAHDGVEAGLAGFGALGEGTAGTDGRVGMGGRSGSDRVAFNGGLGAANGATLCGDAGETAGSVAGAIFSFSKIADTGLDTGALTFAGTGVPSPFEPSGFESAAASDGFSALGEGEGAGVTVGVGAAAADGSFAARKGGNPAKICDPDLASGLGAGAVEADGVAPR